MGDLVPATTEDQQGFLNSAVKLAPDMVIPPLNVLVNQT